MLLNGGLLGGGKGPITPLTREQDRAFLQDYHRREAMQFYNIGPKNAHISIRDDKIQDIFAITLQREVDYWEMN